MKFYIAPMEGITGYIYRNTYQEYFKDGDVYVTPFIAPTQKRCMRTREYTDVLPENNTGKYVIPQIITNKAEDFVWTAGRLKELGYTDVNLNLGCPSGTVVAKKKGAGFLGVPDLLDRFFEETFSLMDREKLDMKVSIKTRVGMSSPDEFEDLIPIYNRYPLDEVMIHPRTRKDQYKNHPDLDAFSLGVKELKHTICYNGDIFDEASYKNICERFPSVDRVMLGRGLIANPGLIRQITTGEVMDKELFIKFHNELFRRYKEQSFGDKVLLFKMKELWIYMICSFTNGELYRKKLLKAKKVSEFQAVVANIFSREEISGGPYVPGMR
ncbi:MAG: tRNA-dihydrouridine synthase family protein [Lachnospiraceae bacterium]|nr:tRNA-dihydrouridine synthase family protein [Lachnospiraceae bacterium]